MAHLAATGARGARHLILELTREEMVVVIRDLTNLLLYSRGTAPSVELDRSSGRYFRLSMTPQPKKDAESGTTEVEEDLAPVFLGGISEE